MPRLTVFLALSLFLFSAFLLACGGSAAPADPAAPPTPTPAPTPTPVPIQVSASKLYQEWGSNQVAAEAKYKDQWVLVTGKIASIAEAGSGYDVKLMTDDFWTRIVCKVDASQVDTILVLQEGQYIAIHGVLEGQGFADIVVQDCAVRDVQESVASAQEEPTAANAEPQAPTESAPTEPAADTVESPSASTSVPEPTSEPTPTPTPEPTATPEPTPTPTPLPPGFTLDNAVAAGGSLNGADGTEILITGVAEDAWYLIQAENQFNDPPQEGNRFYMIALAVGYSGGNGSITVGGGDFLLVGANRAIYDWSNGCGVTPEELEGELYPGGKTQGNLCFEVSADDSEFILIHQSDWDDSSRRFLQIYPLNLGSMADLTVTIPEPDPAALAMSAGMTLDNPAEVGGILPGSNGVETVAVSITSDAWPLIQAENQFNDPPQEGNRFYLVTVEVINAAGSGSVDVSESDFRLIGNNRLVYDYARSCGVTPDELEGELFPGGKTQGNICFEVPQSESGFILIYQPEYEVESRRFLRLE